MSDIHNYIYVKNEKKTHKISQNWSILIPTKCTRRQHTPNANHFSENRPKGIRDSNAAF